MKSLEKKNQIWELVQPLKGNKTMNFKWIFKRNYYLFKLKDARYKDWLVIEGYNYVLMLTSMKYISLKLGIVLSKFYYHWILYELEIKTVWCQNCFFTWRIK
jgi:hypothetical protein